MPITPDTVPVPVENPDFGRYREPGPRERRVSVYDVGAVVVVVDLAAAGLLQRWVRVKVTIPSGAAATVVGVVQRPAGSTTDPDLAARGENVAGGCRRIEGGQWTRYYVEHAMPELALIADGAGAIVEIEDAQV